MGVWIIIPPYFCGAGLMKPDSMQFSITKVDADRYKIIVQDDKEILRSDIINATQAMLRIRNELTALRPMSDIAGYATLVAERCSK